MTDRPINLDSKRQAWQCKIGILAGVEIPPGGDAPMRAAVTEAFFRLTGKYPEANFSGWGAEFTPEEAAVIRNDGTWPAPTLTHCEIVATALASVAASSLKHAERSPYDLGLANGLLLALSTLNGAEYSPLPSPPVYREELCTWGGRYRWLRMMKGAGRLRAAWLACRA